MPLSYRKASAIVKSPDKVAKHAFYPFLDYIITSEIIHKDATTQKLVSEPKNRPIKYASHTDSHIYAYYSDILCAAYEKAIDIRDLSDSVLAFRSLGKSNIEFAKQAFDTIRAYGECGVVALDISGFFNEINHKILKKKWADLLGKPRLSNDHFNIYKSITRWASVDKNKVFDLLGISKHNPKNGRYRICDAKTFRTKIRDGGLIEINLDNKGIPQGSPISALLSNIYMIDFDTEVKSMIDRLGGKYYRYCDDMLLIVPLSSMDQVEAEVTSKITSLKLTINPNKTDKRLFKIKGGRILANKPLQYLGFLYDGKQITIRSAALARYSERMKQAVRRAKMTKIKRNRLKIAAGRKPKPLFKRKLYNKYSHLGKRNFIRYGFRAAEIMNSSAIRRQLKPLWVRLQEEIEK